MPAAILAARPSCGAERRQPGTDRWRDRLTKRAHGRPPAIASDLVVVLREQERAARRARRSGIKAACVVVGGNIERAEYERLYDAVIVGGEEVDRAAYERTFDVMGKDRGSAGTVSRTQKGAVITTTQPRRAMVTLITASPT